MNGNVFNSGNQKPKNVASIKKLALTIAVLAAVVIAFVIILFAVFKDKEPYVFKTPSVTNAPVFFEDDEDSIYYLASKDEPVFLGIGELKNFVSSADGKTVYALISGRTDKALLGESDFILRIEKSRVDTVANFPVGTVSMVSAGNCEYLYYCVNSENSGESVYLLRKGKEPELIIEGDTFVDSPSFAVSPNGHYLICKVASDGETKTVRYSANDKKCISLGIRNCEPVSIDNKGKYFSYLKRSGEKYDFYVESDVEDRQKVELTEEASEILISQDQHSFVIGQGAYVIFKQLGKDPVSVFTNGSENFGIAYYENEKHGYLSIDGEKRDIVRYTFEKSFLPYFYHDSETDEFVCVSNGGTKNTCLPAGTTEYAVSDKLRVAYVSGGSLFCTTLSEKTPASKTVISDFSGNTLFAISRDGQRIYFRDGDGNLFVVSANGNDKTKIAVDVETITSAKSGNAVLYVGDGMLTYKKGATVVNIDSEVGECVYTTADLKNTVYLKTRETKDDGQSFDLYVGNTKKPRLIYENVKKIVTYPEFYVAENLSAPEDDDASLENEQ